MILDTEFTGLYQRMTLMSKIKLCILRVILDLKKIDFRLLYFEVANKGQVQNTDKWLLFSSKWIKCLKHKKIYQKILFECKKIACYNLFLLKYNNFFHE